MKVLHIITGLKRGGAETLLYRICQFDEDYEHTVVSLTDAQNYGKLLGKINISVHALNFPNGKIKISGLVKLYKLIKKIKPDVVQTWMSHADLIGGIIARCAGIKNIFWGVHHTFLIRGKSKIATMLIVRLNAILSFVIPKKIIYCAKKSREIQESIGFKKSKGIVIQNGYDIKSFKEDMSLERNFRDEIGISPDSFVIGHVGSFDPLKDQKTLIESLAYLNCNKFNFTAVLVGTNLDSTNKKLVKLISDNGLSSHVHLLGIRNDISAVMNGIDIFILSSISEAFPNVLNEAMACSTPCITTNVGDAALIVGNTGWIVETRNPKALAEASIEAIKEKNSNKKSWMHRKESCRKRIVNNFDFEKMIKKYKEVWGGNH
jgi:glycosyltransferase involved in cell wall biosynthesis